MRKTTFPGLLFTLALSINLSAEDAHIDSSSTMCREGEDIYISCSFPPTPQGNKKAASICAKDNKTLDSGYIQYRYGTPGERPDLQYPENIKSSNKKFMIYKSENSKGVSQSISFTNGSHTYSFEKHGLSSYHLVVKKNGNEVFNKTCDEPGKNYISDKAFYGIRIKNNE